MHLMLLLMRLIIRTVIAELAILKCQVSLEEAAPAPDRHEIIAHLPALMPAVSVYPYHLVHPLSNTLT